MNNTIYSHRQTLKNRKSKPLFKKMGVLPVDDYINMSNQARAWSLQDTLQLRDKNGTGYDVDKLYHYNHSVIQHCGRINEPETTDYVNVYPEYLSLHKNVSNILGNVYRMRWARLESNKTLDWHIDPPTGDRFIFMIKGEHTVSINDEKTIHEQIMLPGEIWYINSNWFHKVTNHSAFDRFAILGCFDLII